MLHCSASLTLDPQTESERMKKLPIPNPHGSLAKRSQHHGLAHRPEVWLAKQTAARAKNQIPPAAETRVSPVPSKPLPNLATERKTRHCSQCLVPSFQPAVVPFFEASDAESKDIEFPLYKCLGSCASEICFLCMSVLRQMCFPCIAKTALNCEECGQEDALTRCRELCDRMLCQECMTLPSLGCPKCVIALLDTRFDPDTQ